MFNNSNFEKRNILEKNHHNWVWIISEKWQKEIELEWLKVFNGEDGDPYRIGSISKAEVISEDSDSYSFRIYFNTHTRFHSTLVTIPKHTILNRVGIYWDYDHKNDYLFVKDEWIEMFYTGNISSYVLIDAIGMKQKMKSENNEILLKQLNNLSVLIDKIAKENPDMHFVSAADNIIVKYSVPVRYNDEEFLPENLLNVCLETQSAIKLSLGCDSYGIFTQGFNIYNDNINYYTNENHTNMRSLGWPYRDLFIIENRVREDKSNRYNSYFSLDYFLTLNVDRELLGYDNKKHSSQEYIGLDLKEVISCIKK